MTMYSMAPPHADAVQGKGRGERDIRVLHVYRTYFPDPPGGVQEVIRQICRSTRSLGISSSVFCLSPDPHPSRIDWDGVPVYRRRSWMAPASCDLGGAAAFGTFRKLAGEADIIHYHYPWPFADVLHAIAPKAVASIMTYHSDIVRQKYLYAFYKPLMWRMLSSMDRIVSTSSEYARSSPVLSSEILKDKVSVIPIGLDEPHQEQDEGIFGRIGIDRDQPYFLFVGALRYYKNLETLIKAASIVNVPMVIAGSGPSLQALRTLAAESQASNVIFAGQVSEAQKEALLASCRAVVLPSHLRSEAFGVVLLEASRAGKAMLTCDIGTGSSYVNVHGETGLVVAPTHEALTVGLEKLAMNGELARVFGRNALKRFEHHFTAARMGAAYANEYRLLAGAQRT